MCARALPLGLAAMLACGVNGPPAPAAPNDAPARDVIVRTSRFAIHANAYVDFYASALADSLPEGGADAGSPRLDAALVTKLGGCSDDPCAKSALVGTRFDGLGDFLRDTWAAHAIDSRRTLGREGTPLMDLEDVLAAALARQMGVAWPNDPVAVYVAHEGARRGGEGGRDGAVLDASGECFTGEALLECLFTQALEVLLPGTALGGAIEEEGARRGDAGRAASASLMPCIAVLATDVAVAASELHYRPTRRFVAVCSEPARAWLGVEWPKRMRGDEPPKAFAARLIGEAVRAGW